MWVEGWGRGRWGCLGAGGGAVWWLIGGGRAWAAAAGVSGLGLPVVVVADLFVFWMGAVGEGAAVDGGHLRRVA